MNDKIKRDILTLKMTVVAQNQRIIALERLIMPRYETQVVEPNAKKPLTTEQILDEWLNGEAK